MTLLLGVLTVAVNLIGTIRNSVNSYMNPLIAPVGQLDSLMLLILPMASYLFHR